MNVALPPRLMLLEENCTVIPVGSERVESATFAVKPLPAATVIVVAAELPGATPTLDGAAVNVNDAPGLTVTVTGMTILLIRLPLVPVMVIDSDAATAALLAETVTTLEPDPGAAIVDGANPTVTPAGSALPPLKSAVRTTAPLKLFAPVLVNVNGVLAPC
jgi:hypothetical protein